MKKLLIVAISMTLLLTGCVIAPYDGYNGYHGSYYYHGGGYYGGYGHRGYYR